MTKENYRWTHPLSKIYGYTTEWRSEDFLGEGVWIGKGSRDEGVWETWHGQGYTFKQRRSFGSFTGSSLEHCDLQ